MYLGYQQNKIKFYTEAPLDMVLYNLDLIEETQDEYVLDGDEYVPKDEQWYAKELVRVKEAKLQENETIRDNFLISGVVYKGILWDSDIEQKLNISVQLNNMGDEDTVTWVAMDGVTSLECTKQDLMNIGMLLTQMTAYVWQYKNPEIKTAINNAETIEEVEAIEIVYELSEIEELNRKEDEEVPTENINEPKDNQ